MNTPGQGHAQAPVNDWQDQNNLYLALSLHWLRLRLAHALPVLASQVPAPAPASTPAPVAEPAQRPRFMRGAAAPAVVPAPAVTATAPPPPPTQASDTLAAAAAAREAAARTDPPPALCLLAQRLGLSEFERDTLLLCAAAEIDPGIASLFAQVQGRPGAGAPNFALALHALDGPRWDALSSHRPLRGARLVELGAGTALPLTTTPLRVDERVVHYLKGLNVIDERLSALLAPAADDGDAPLAASQRTVAGAIQAQLQLAAARAQIPLVLLVGTDAGSKLDVARQVCRALGRHLYRLSIDALPAAKSELDALARLWQRERLLLPITLYLDADDLHGASPEVANAFSSFVTHDIGLAFVGLRETPARAPGGALSFDVDKPTTREQHDAWQDALAAAALGEQGAKAAPLLAGQFDLNLGDIERSMRAAQPAQQVGEQVGAQAPPASERIGHIWQACRQLTQPRLDQLAQRLEPKATWDDLVLSDEATALLRQVAGQVRNRFQVYEDWGYAERMTRGLGISALFAGESGTGKTMAAEVIARELNLALYRIDLSAVVSKYIGETEKNLRRLFDSAEQGGAILLFDEADALFGKRSEVKDSHDRYANIEINYLLQRMEAFSGLAILATNMKGALDNAFMRRLRFVVNFPYPGPAERLRMWQRALPAHLPRDADIDFARLARLGLSGGNIHSIALNAAFMAAARGTPLSQAMLLAAARTELRKLDKPVNEAGLR